MSQENGNKNVKSAARRRTIQRVGGPAVRPPRGCQPWRNSLGREYGWVIGRGGGRGTVAAYWRYLAVVYQLTLDAETILDVAQQDLRGCWDLPWSLGLKCSEPGYEETLLPDERDDGSDEAAGLAPAEFEARSAFVWFNL